MFLHLFICVCVRVCVHVELRFSSLVAGSLPTELSCWPPKLWLRFIMYVYASHRWM